MVVTTPLIYLWRREYRRAALFFAAMMPAVVGWQWWASAHRAEASPATLFYTDYVGFYRNDVTLAGLPDLLFSNSNLTFKAIGELFIFDSDDGIGAVTIARVVTLAVIAGCVRLVRNGRMVHYTAFAAAYAGQFLVWNYPPTHRFLLPLLPLLAAGVWRELRTLPGIVATGFRKRGVERATALAICGLIGFFGWQSARWSVYGLTVLLPQMFEEQRQELDRQREPRRWIAEHVRPGGAVLSYEDPLDYLYSAGAVIASVCRRASSGGVTEKRSAASSASFPR
jgi:hypothetical protein